MSDFEDFFLESWTSPEKRKRKKDKKVPKRQDRVNVKPHENVQRKKKKKKFKDAMEARKEKKKKKEKKEKPLDPEDSVVSARGPDRPTRDSAKKTKWKKKVAFDLSPGVIRVKRPKFVSSSPKVEEVEGEGGAIAATGLDNDSQCNSQDLFITQKTFRASPPEPSSGETSVKTVPESPQVFTQRDRKRPEVKRFKEEGDQCPDEPRTEDKRFQKLHELSLRTQTEFKVNLAEQEKVANPFLDEPVVIISSPDVAKTKKSSSNPPRCIESSRRPPATSTASTQTENFFTAELSSYASFVQRAASLGFDDLRPLDLSLPQRARRDPRAEVKEKKQEVSGERKKKTTPSGRGETTPSYESEPEAKSADTTTSGEDGELPTRPGKLDLTQVRAVQMRLNESFFFKTKGEGQSPRPESPLMKLAQGRDTRSRRGHRGHRE